MRDKPTIDSVVEHYGLRPDRQGFILCPVHEERTPSCQLHDDWWYCYGCQATGDSLGLIAAITRVPIADVLAEYGERTPSWKTQARKTKHLDPEAVAAAPYRAFRRLRNWFFDELAARMNRAPDWLQERTVVYWSSVFDEWAHLFDRKHPEYSNPGAARQEERLKALSALLERGLHLEQAAAWDHEEGEWRLTEAARVQALRDRGPR